ncbi:MAG: S1-like domain-containing RNA-binding protein [Alistipes sp.]|nr:S1-like domain-containing RNA-binding protein [Alistipes sp.]
MLIAGHYYTLTIHRVSDYGLYLVDEEEAEVLLPNRYVSLAHKVGQTVEVFVYHDSEDRLVATTEHPLATVGQVAVLKVVDKTVHGVFLDWGLPAKDLFLPNRNQSGRMEIGSFYPVYLYTDNITGRVVASSYLKGWISNTELSIAPQQRVEALVVTEMPIGFRAVINHRHWGMLYRNQLFRPIQIGDRLEAYVTRITPDNRVDLSLQQQGYDEVKFSAERIEALMREGGGRLALHDGSTPEQIKAVTQMSKKVFKRSVGYLLKLGKIKMDAEGIELI